MNKILDKLTPPVRRKLYAIAVVIGALLVGHGLLSANDASSYLQILGIALGTIAAPALARANTPKGGSASD